MANDRQHVVDNLFTQVDISPSHTAPTRSQNQASEEQILLLRQLVQGVDRQNELLEELVTQHATNQRNRQAELDKWKDANPVLAKKCRGTADLLAKIHSEYLDRITDEVDENSEALTDGDFMLSEFVDRYGPRLAHLNGLLQIFSQLGVANPATPASE